MLIAQPDVAAPLFDTTALHAAAAVDRALREPKGGSSTNQCPNQVAANGPGRKATCLISTPRLAGAP